MTTPRSISVAVEPKMSQLEAELLWQLALCKVPVSALEYKFHPTRKWKLDIAWPDLLVACEVEGGTFTAGRHVTGVGFEKDAEKYNEAAILGWLVIRVTRNMVESGMARDQIERALAARSQVVPDAHRCVPCDLEFANGIETAAHSADHLQGRVA